MKSDIKIRIVSFQNAHNFGAVCQAYGLQQTLYELGYKDVLFINYNPQYLKDRYDTRNLYHLDIKNVSLKHKITRPIKWLGFAISNYLRNMRFRNSIHRLIRQTPNELSNSQACAQYNCDVLICGSDQIWNTSLTHCFDPVFFGNIPWEEKPRLVSYAPSTELFVIKENDKHELRNLLDSFDSISVREITIRDYLAKVTNKSISVCVDPTILCSSNAYNKIASKRLVKRPYICVYAYFPDETIIQQLIKSIPQYEKYEVHYLLFTAQGWDVLTKSNYHSAISIEDFLSYFKYADYVVTNSFHGLAFSLLFERNFNVAKYEGKSGRAQSLLNQINMLDRFVEDPLNTHWDAINYNDINSRMQLLRKSSIEYLITNI